MRVLACSLITAFLISIASLPPVKADGCNLRVRSAYTTYTPVYAQAQAHTYDPALYYYKDGYYYPYKQKAQQVLLVPKAIEVEVQRRHYYSIDPYAQQNLLADAIVGRLLRMQAINATTTAAAAAVTVVPSGTPTLPGVVPGAMPGAVPRPTIPDDTPRAGAYQEPKIIAVIQASCAKCHGATSKQSRLLTVDGKLNDLPAGKVWEAFGLVNSGEMPKASKSLDDESVKLFYAWAKNARK